LTTDPASKAPDSPVTRLLVITRRRYPTAPAADRAVVDAGSVPDVTRLTEWIPSWAAWPASALSTLAAVAGSGLVLHAAAFGSVRSAAWAALAFVAAALLWFVADVATAGRRW
jgi:hypothetical protein